jgi:hypothetical protein
MTRIARGISLILFFGLVRTLSAFPQGPPSVIHVFVALADNQHQGIIPVPPVLGNGNDPARNLYWGAAFGVKTFFQRSKDWELISAGRGPKKEILERCVFKFKKEEVYLIADAYEGSQIRMAVTDFLSAAAGVPQGPVSVSAGQVRVSLPVGGGSDLVAYVGHDAFMDFQVPPVAGERGPKPRRAIVLACASKQYFASYLRRTGAEPLLWTTGLMAPEAYTLKAAVDAWIAGEGSEAIRQRAARAYDAYQKCGLRAALRLFSTGW